MTAPRQMTASNLPLSAIFFATTGISNAPGTQATVTSSSGTLWRRSASVAPPSSFVVMNSLKRAHTMPTFMPSLTTLPSMMLIAMMKSFP